MQPDPHKPFPRRPVPPSAERARFLLLIVDPDPDATDDLAAQLQRHQIDVQVSHDPADAMLLAGILRPDAVLTAAIVAPLSGSAIARALHTTACIPTLVGVGGADAGEARRSRAAGATACVDRPYRVAEVLQTLRSVSADATDVHAPVRAGPLRLDPDAFEVRCRGKLLALTPREFELLHVLMLHAGQVVTRAHISQMLWRGEDTTNTISVHIRRLRSRLGDDQHHPYIILTVRGRGYRLVPPKTRHRVQTRATSASPRIKAALPSTPAARPSQPAPGGCPFEQLLHVSQCYAVIREEQARDFTLACPVLRTAVLPLSDHLIAAGIIKQRDDVSFCTRQDVATGLARRQHEQNRPAS